MCLASSERWEATLHDCVVINEGEHQLPAVLPNDIFSEQATLAKRAKRTPSRQGSGPRPKILAQKKTRAILAPPGITLPRTNAPPRSMMPQERD